MSAFPGCAAITAIRQPGKKNLQVLNGGTARENVITYLGAPISSEEKDGKRTDLYEYVQGYSGGAKATRAVCHLALDGLTLFIWELIGWPAEMIFNGEKNTVKVTYDKNDRVEDAIFLRLASQHQ